MYENELYHHGIKGQKWGVRRFQDYNGHLIGTDRIYKRASKLSQKTLAADRNRQESYKTRDSRKIARAEKAYYRAKAKSSAADSAASEKYKKNEHKLYKKTLNVIDQGLSEERRDASESKRALLAYYNAGHKAKAKADKAAARGDIKRSQKYMAKAVDLMNRSLDSMTTLSEHTKNIKRGQELTQKLISEANAKNYDVISRQYFRDVTRLSDLGVTVLDPEGLKYNVKRRK